MSLRKAISLNAVASKETHLIRREARKERKKRKASDPINFQLVRPRLPQHNQGPCLSPIPQRTIEHEEHECHDQDHHECNDQFDDDHDHDYEEEMRGSSFAPPVVLEETKETSKSLPTLHKSKPLVDMNASTATSTKKSRTAADDVNLGHHTLTTTSTTPTGPSFSSRPIHHQDATGVSHNSSPLLLQPSQIHNNNNHHVIINTEEETNTHLPAHLCGDIKHTAAQLSHIKPTDFVMSCYDRYNIPHTNAVSLSIQNYFLPITNDNLNAYQADAIQAIRTKDVSSLRRIRKTGRILQGSNRFGESFMHIACRRGSLDILEYLLKEGGCSLRVHDDYGRTPLHDACWQTKPDFNLIEMILNAEPDLLLMKDKRGYTALEYTRKEDWGLWIKYLSHRVKVEILRKREKQGEEEKKV